MSPLRRRGGGGGGCTCLPNLISKLFVSDVEEVAIPFPFLSPTCLMLHLGTGHYLCRWWKGKKKGGGGFKAISDWLEGGEQFDCEVYFKRGLLAKMGKAFKW